MYGGSLKVIWKGPIREEEDQGRAQLGKRIRGGVVSGRWAPNGGLDGGPLG